MPDTAQTVPLFGFGVGTKSPNVSAQMRTNLYVEKYDDPDKSAMALYSRPGLKRFTVANADSGGPIRGAISDAISSGAGAETAWFAQGRSIVGIFPDGSFNSSGVNLSTSAGVVRSAQIGTTGVCADGVTGYKFDVSNPSVPVVVDLAIFPQAAAFPFTTKSVTACASRIIAVDPSNIGRFRWSAAGDVTTWNALDFATAESSPDPLSAVFEMAGTLLLIGTQTIEFWAPAAAGAAGQLPFVRTGGANIQWGTTALDTIRKCNDSMIFLGRNQGGARQVVQIRGYDAQPISTADVEADIATEPLLDAATALFMVVAGHAFYVLNLSTHSWAYDMRTGTWAKWLTDGARFAGQWSLVALNQILVTDYRDARVYTLDTSTFADDGAVLVREVVSKHASANLARISCRELAIDCETGLGSTDGTAPVSPQLMLSWSKDGGHTWGNEVWQSLGPVGNYKARAVWRNLGRSRDFVFKARIADAVKVVLIGAAAIFAP